MPLTDASARSGFGWISPRVIEPGGGGRRVYAYRLQNHTPVPRRIRPGGSADQEPWSKLSPPDLVGLAAGRRSGVAGGSCRRSSIDHKPEDHASPKHGPEDHKPASHAGMVQAAIMQSVKL